MNNYNLIFGGAAWIMILLMIAALIFTFYIYRRTTPPIPTSKKMLLRALRSLALLSLIFFLFEPILSKRSGLEKPPIIRVLADNSLSMSLIDADGDRGDTYYKALEILDFQNKNEAIEFFSFDETIKQYNEFAFDSLSLDADLTNISKAIEISGAKNNTENVRATLLITDGRYTSGENPVYAVDNLGLPVYVLAIGDSNHPKDIIVKTLLTNEIGYIGSLMPVNVKVEINGYTGDSIIVKLFDNQRFISEQYLSVLENQSSYSLLFDYKPTTAGTHKITAKIEAQEEELTVENNAASQFIKVLEKKRTIAIIGGAPNSDIAFIKKYLTEDRDIQVIEYIQKIGGDFYSTPTAASLDEAQVIIMSDFPNESTPNNVIQLLKKQLANKKPLFFIAGYNTNYRKLKELEDFLPFNTLKTGKREFTATPFLDAHSLGSPLINITGTDADLDIWNKLPPIFKTETFVRVKPESDFVAGLKVNNVDLQQPLILTRFWQGQKTVAVLGYGIYRWKLMGQAADMAVGKFDSPDVFAAFMENSLKWLSASNRDKKFIVKTLKKQYTLSETVEFSGELYDAAFTPIDAAEIQIMVASNGKSTPIFMHGIGNGRYAAKIDGLAKGDYTFKATAMKNKRTLGKENNVFSVGDISPELLNITMNAKLLREIAERSGGKFYTPDMTDQIIDDIKSDPLFKSYSITIKNDINLWNKWELLMLAIICFALEWFLRKRNGLL